MSSEESATEGQSDESPRLYEVERILGCKKRGTEIFYLIKWKGYSEKTWEPAEECRCPEKIAEYYERKESRERSLTSDSVRSVRKKRRRKDWSMPRTEPSKRTTQRRSSTRSRSRLSSFSIEERDVKPVTRKIKAEEEEESRKQNGEEGEEEEVEASYSDATFSKLSPRPVRSRKTASESSSSRTDAERAAQKSEDDLRVLRETLQMLESDVRKCAILHSTRLPGLNIFDHAAYVRWLRLNNLDVPRIDFYKDEPEHIFNREVDRILAISSCHGGYFLVKTRTRPGEGAVPLENLVFAVSSELVAKLLPATLERFARRSLAPLASFA